MIRGESPFFFISGYKLSEGYQVEHVMIAKYPFNDVDPEGQHVIRSSYKSWFNILDSALPKSHFHHRK